MSVIFAVFTALLDMVLNDSACYCVLKRARRPAWQPVAFLLGDAAAVAALSYSGLHSDIVFVISMGLLFCYALLFYTGDTVMKLFAVCLLAEVTLAGDQLGAGIVTLFYPVDSAEIRETSELLWLGGAAFYFYAAAMAVLFYRFPINTEIIPRGKCLAMLCVPISAGLLSYVTYTLWKTLPYVSGWAYLLPFIMFVLLTVFTLLYLRITARAELDRRMLDVLGAQLDDFGESYQSVVSDIDAIRAFRHEAAHHFDAIRGLAGGGNLSEVAAYIEGIRPALEEMEGVQLSRNAVVDTLLRQKKGYAERYGIRFYADRVAVPERIALPSPDLCVILSNALDNAIEACRRIDDVEARYIDIRMFIRGPGLFIFIENSIAEQPEMVKGRVVSTKPGRQGYGFGLANIQRLVARHGGVMLPQWYDRTFMFNCSIKLDDDIEEETHD